MKMQSGMSFLGMIFTVAVITIIGITVMRIVPVYLQYYEVLQSVQALKQIPESEFTHDPLADANMLRTKLSNQFYVNGVEIPKDKILIKPQKEGKYKVAITYQEKRKLVGNMSLLFDFDVSEEVTLDNP